MRISELLRALVLLLAVALPSARVAAQSSPPRRCVGAVDGAAFAGGWADFHLVLLPVTTRLDCPLTEEVSGGLDWAFVYHSVNENSVLIAGNPYLHVAWSRRFGRLRPTLGGGLVAPNTSDDNPLDAAGRARALAANGYLEPWLHAPGGAWFVLRAGLALDGVFLLEADGALAGYVARSRANDGLSAQLSLALGARIAHRLELGVRLGLYGDLAGKLLPSPSELEFSLVPFVRLRLEGLRLEAGLGMNLGPALPRGLQDKAFWSIRLGVAAEL